MVPALVLIALLALVVVLMFYSGKPRLAVAKAPCGACASPPSRSAAPP